MKAVFFFIEESREPCTENTSIECVSMKLVGCTWLLTLLAIPRPKVELTKLPFMLLVSCSSDSELHVRFLGLSMVE